MTQRELDYLHEQGKILDWYYYQQSDKPIWMKMQEQTDSFYKEVQERKEKQEQEKLLEEELRSQVETVVEKVLGELFDDLTN